MNLSGPDMGMTATAQGLNTALTQCIGGPGNRPDQPDFIMIITDGSPNIALDGTRYFDPNVRTQAWDDAYAQALLAMQQNVTVIVVAVGDWAQNSNSMLLLEMMASEPTNRTLYYISNFADLASIHKTLAGNVTCEALKPSEYNI